MRNTRKLAFSDDYVGKRVRVIGPGHYGGRCIGQIGTIQAVWSTSSIAVELDFEVNQNSAHGYFYFKISELEVITQENTKTATAAEKGETEMYKLTNYLNVAKVQFLNDDTPFRVIECANYDPNLLAGSLCVVKTASHGMGLAEVVEIHEHTDNDLYREVVSRVDTGAYNFRVEQRRRAADLKNKMQERAKKLQDIVLYQTLAKEDPEMAQMLKEYADLALI